MRDSAKVNPNGSVITRGHLIGTSGTTILKKAIYELIRTGDKYDLTTMRIGGGQGIAVVVENAEADSDSV